MRRQLSAANQQLALHVERGAKPRANDATRLTFVGLSRLIDWRQVLIVVKPETVIRWHGRDLACPGNGNRGLVADRGCQSPCSNELPRWRRRTGRGVRKRIASELLVKLGIRISARTVRRRCRPVRRVLDRGGVSALSVGVSLCGTTRARCSPATSSSESVERVRLSHHRVNVAQLPCESRPGRCR
jgi:hypothetical protein